MARRSVKEYLFYGGVSKEEYEDIKPLIAEENHKVWRILSIVLEILFIGLFVFALLMDGDWAGYVPGFGILAGLMIIAVLAFLVFLKPSSKALTPFIYATVIITLGVFIYTSVFVEHYRPTAVIPALVVGLSFVTLDRPIRYSSLLLSTLIIFLPLTIFFKDSWDIKIFDIVDATVFTLAAILISVFISTTRTRDLVLRSIAERDRDTDALTSVSNKMAYDRTVNMISIKMKEDNFKFAVAICDINGLKVTNDTYGHEEGDKLLLRCCNLLKESFANSVIYRIGGDEFAIIITGEDYKNREQIIRELHEKVEKAHEGATSLVDDTSIAIGVAVYDRKRDHDFISVFSRADAEMYDNKRITKSKNSYLSEQ